MGVSRKKAKEQDEGGGFSCRAAQQGVCSYILRPPLFLFQELSILQEISGNLIISCAPVILIAIMIGLGTFSPRITMYEDAIRSTAGSWKSWFQPWGGINALVVIMVLVGIIMVVIVV